MKNATLVRGHLQPPKCPPKHELTASRALVNREVVGATSIELYLVEISTGGEALPDAHPGCEHGFFILSGNGEAEVNAQRFVVSEGDCLFIPPGAEHAIRPSGHEPLRMIVFFSPHR